MEERNQNTIPGDYIVRATALDHMVRATAVRSTDVCRAMTEIHGLSPAAAAALGRLCTGLLMMSQELKEGKGSVSASIRCEGPLKNLTAVCTPQARVRGYVGKPVVETVYKAQGKLDIGVAVGKGTLTIIRDTGFGKPYIGQTELISGEIAEDLAAYFLLSEQIPSVVSLGVKMDRNGITHAGGLIVQLMPDAGEDILHYIEQRASGFPEITWLCEEGFSPHEMLDLFFGDPNIEYYEPHPCEYGCDCSEERMIKGLLAIGAKELESLSQDPCGIELECHFCRKKYRFDQEQVLRLAETAKK